MRGYRSDSLAARLAWACAAIVLMGAVAMGRGAGGSTSPEELHVLRWARVVNHAQVRTPDGGTRFVGVYSGATSSTSDDPNFTEADARRQFEHESELILRAKATGKATVVKRRETDFGTVVTYRATLDDGRVVTWAGSPEDVMTPEQRTERQKQFDASCSPPGSPSSSASSPARTA